MVDLLARLLLGPLVPVLLVVAGAGLAGRLVPELTGARWLGGWWTLTVALAMAVFESTLTLGVFQLPVVLLLAGAGVALGLVPAGSDRRRGLAVARDRLQALGTTLHGSVLRRARGPWGLLALGVSVVVGARLVRGLGLPPLGWDALTYHLYRAGRWVREGHLALQDAPDAWGAYQGYPTAADGLWALAMLGAHDDALVPLVGLAAWAGVPLATWGLARALGADRQGAGLAAVVAGGMGCVLGLLTNGYVDNLACAGALLAATGVVRGDRGGPALVALLAAAVAAATRLPQVSMVVILGAWYAWRERGAPQRVLAAAVAAVVVCQHYLRAWVAWGSPTWPVPVRLGPIVFAGDPTYAAVISRPAEVTAEGIWSLLVGMPSRAEQLGPGLAMLVVVPLALAALRRPPAPRWGGPVVLGFVALQALPLLHPDSRALVTWWADTSPRLVSPAFAALCALAAATTPAGWARRALVVAAAVQVVQARPDLADATVLATLAPTAGVVVGAVTLVAWSWRRGGRWRAAAALVAWLLGGATWLQARDAARVPIWSSLPEGGAAYDWHTLVHPGTVAAPAWAALADAPPRRIAVVPGGDGFANQYWYLYPLLGRRLQHEVVYVPPSRDGLVRARGDASLATSADREAWLAALEAAGVDGVVLLPFRPLERAWVEALPDRFTPEATAAEGRVGLWRFR